MEREISFNLRANASGVKSELNRLANDVRNLRNEQNSLSASSNTNTAATDKQSNSFRGFARTLGDVAKAQRDVEVSARTLARASADAGRAQQEAATAARNTAASVTEAATAHRNATSSVDMHTRSTETYSQATERSTRATQSHNSELGNSRSRFAEVTGTLSRLITEQNRYEGTLKSVTQANEKYARASRSRTQATIDHINAQRTLEAADARYNRILNDSTSTLAQQARAQETVAKSQMQVANTASRVESATRAETEAHRRLNAEIIASENAMNRLRSAGQGVGSVFSNFGGFVSIVTSAFGQFASMSIVPILTQMIPLVGSLGGGFVALASAISPVVGLLGALPGAAVGLGSMFGVLTSSFSGIGSALKAYDAQQAKAASSTGKNTAAARNQAIAVRNARQALAAAKENAASAESKAAERVKEAETSAAESIKKAYRSLSDARAKAAEDNAAAAKRVSEVSKKAAEDNAEAARSTSDAMQKAARDNAKAARDTSDAIAKAAEDDKKATADVARAREQAARQIESAQRDVASSEKNLEDAQISAKRAQQDLSQARVDAVQYLKDMQKAVRDASFSEEEAVLGLERARERMQKANSDPRASSLDRRQADLDYREAQARLADARSAKTKAIKENADAQKKGVEGSDLVVNANQRIADASSKVVEAQNRLAESQRGYAEAQKEASQKIAEALANQKRVHQEGARAVADAQANQTRTAQEGARAVSDAQAKQAKAARDGSAAIAEAKAQQVKTAAEGNRSISDAEENLAKTQRDSAKSIADAKRAQAETIRSSNESVRKAQQALNDALQKQDMGAATAGANAYEAALKKLTPAQRQFLNFLIQNKAKLQELKDAASASFLPYMQRAMENVMPLFPIVKRGVADMGTAMGGFIEKTSEALASGENMSALDRIFDSNRKAMVNATAGAGGYVNAFMRIGDAARPLVEWLGKLVGDFGRYLDQVTRVNKANGDMARFFTKTKDTMSVLGNILRNVGNMFRALGRASSDTGRTMLGDFEQWTDKLQKFMNSAEGQNKLKKWFEDVKKQLDHVWPVISKIGSAFAELTVSKGFSDFMDSLSKKDGAIDQFKGLLKTISDSDMPATAGDTLGKLAGAVKTLLDSGGADAFANWGKALGLVADVLTTIGKNPAGAAVLTGLLTTMAAGKTIKTMNEVSKSTGLTDIKRFAQKRRVDRVARERAGEVDEGIVTRVSRPILQRRDATNNAVRGAGRTVRAGASSARDTGRDVVSGFTSGVSSRASSVLTAASNLARRFIDRVRSSFRIKSPSRVMMDIAGDVVRGFTNGIGNKVRTVQTAAERLEDRVTATLRTVPSGVRAAGEAAGAAYASGFAGASGVKAPTVSGGGKSAASSAGGSAADSIDIDSSSSSDRRRRGGDSDSGEKKSRKERRAEKKSAKKSGKRGGKRGGKMAGLANIADGAGDMAGLLSMIGPLTALASVVELVMFAFSALAPVIAAISTPILVVIGVITAIGAALYLLYQKNETFRNAVNAAWEAIKNAISLAWNQYIWPALKAFGSFIWDNLVTAMNWLWKNVMVPAWNGISTAISWAWNTVIKPVFGFLWNFVKNYLITVFQTYWAIAKAAWSGISTAVSWAWNNIIKPVFSALWGFVVNQLVPIFNAFWQTTKLVWNGIQTAISWAWNNIIKPVFSAIWNFVSAQLSVVFRTLWSVVKFVWESIRSVISWSWNNIIRPTFDALKRAVQWVWEKFQAMWRHIRDVWDWVSKKISDVWGAIRRKFGEITSYLGGVFARAWDGTKRKISEVWDGISRKISGAWTTIKGTFTKLTDYLGGTFKRAWESARDMVGRVWDGIKSKALEPVKYVWNNIVVDKLISKFNWLVGKIPGADSLEIKGVQRLASGGRVQGSSPHARADNIPAMLTAGEWVQPVAAVQHYGPEFMESIRRREFPKNAVRRAAGGPIDELRSEGGISEKFRRLRKKSQNYRDGGMVSAATTQGGVFSSAPSLTVATGDGVLKIAAPTATVDGADAYAKGGGVSFRPSMTDDLIAYGRELQKRGVTVLENAAFTGRTPRTGHMKGSLHYSNNALDVSGGPGWPRTGNQIYNEARKRGLAAIWQSAGHYNHVHIDTGMYSKYHDRLIKTGWSAGDYISDAVGDIAGLLGGKPLDLLKSAVTSLTSKIPGANSNFGKMLTQVPLGFLDQMAKNLEEKFSMFGNQGEAGGGDVNKYMAVAAQALRIAGVNGKHLALLMHRMQVESGGDPMAVNKWDSNWRAGTPSVGLMQVIGPTYRQWRDPKHDKGPYVYGTSVDPLSNILAAVRYTRSRYKGNFQRAWGGRQGYAEGGQVAGHGNTDSVKAMLMPGEFVIRKEAVRRIGAANLHQLNNIDRPGHRTSGTRAMGTQRFATGGMVAPTGPINGIKQGSKSWGWNLVRQLFNLPISPGGFFAGSGPAIGWDRALTDAYRKRNYQIPSLSKTLDAAGNSNFKQIIPWMKSFGTRMRSTLGRLAHVSRDRRGRKATTYSSAPTITVREMQKIVGTKVDGVIGRDTTMKLRKYRAEHGLRDNKKKPWDSEVQRYMSMDSFPGRWTGTVPRLWSAAGHFKHSIMAMRKWFIGDNVKRIEKFVPAALRRSLLTEAANIGDGSTSKGFIGKWTKALQKLIGAAETGIWGGEATDDNYDSSNANTVDMAAAMKYVMDKGLKRPTASVFPPWWNLSPIQEAIENQTKSNVDQTEFLKALDSLSQWGLNYLVEDLQGAGVENGLPIAKSALASKALATQYNNELKRKQELAATGTEDYTKFVATIQAPGEQLGIRKMAQTLGIADFAVVDMWKKLLKAGRIKPSERTSALERDVRLFDRGVFYANTGGRVPGFGDTDTVPAMLTPGEFVLKKAAVKAIGLENLYALNQGYNQGGFVYNMGSVSMRSEDMKALGAVAGMSAGMDARPVVVNNNTTIATNIYNPVREPSTKSMNKMLRQRATLGGSTVGTDTVNGEM